MGQKTWFCHRSNNHRTASVLVSARDVCAPQREYPTFSATRLSVGEPLCVRRIDARNQHICCTARPALKADWMRFLADDNTARNLVHQRHYPWTAQVYLLMTEAARHLAERGCGADGLKSQAVEVRPSFPGWNSWPCAGVLIAQWQRLWQYYLAVSKLTSSRRPMFVLVKKS